MIVGLAELIFGDSPRQQSMANAKFPSANIQEKFSADRFACVRNAKRKKKTWGSPTSSQKEKRVEIYPNFENLAHVIQHGLQGFIGKRKS